MDNLHDLVFLGVPPVTKFFFVSVLAVSILSASGYISPSILAFDYSKVILDHQYWRLITCFIYSSPLSLTYMVYLFINLDFMKSIEESFVSQPIYVFMWYLMSDCAVILLCKQLFYPTPRLLGNSFYLSDLLDSLFYLKVRRYSNTIINFMGFVEINASYLPSLLPFIEMLFYSQPIGYAVRKILLNNLIYFLWDIFPKMHGFCVLSPPWSKYQN